MPSDKDHPRTHALYPVSLLEIKHGLKLKSVVSIIPTCFNDPFVTVESHVPGNKTTGTDHASSLQYNLPTNLRLKAPGSLDISLTPKGACGAFHGNNKSTGDWLYKSYNSPYRRKTLGL